VTWSFLAGSALGHLTLPARIAAVRRLAPDRAPCAVPVATVEMPIATVDAACTAVAIALAVGGPPVWAATAIVGVVAFVALQPSPAARPVARGPRQAPSWTRSGAAPGSALRPGSR
jgi:hypothetical protein